MKITIRNEIKSRMKIRSRIRRGEQPAAAGRGDARVGDLRSEICDLIYLKSQKIEEY